jgi:hypothetical protein
MPMPQQPVAVPGPARFGNIVDQVEQANTQIRPASSFNEQGMHPQAIAALAALEQMHGGPFSITSAYRDPARNAAVGGAQGSQHMRGTAFDISVRDMPIEQRQALIRQAREAGFTGIGVYNNSLHFDIGPDRHWGPDYRAGSLPAWAREAVGAPVGQNRTAAGGIAAMAQDRPASGQEQGGGLMQGQQRTPQGGLLGTMSSMGGEERRPSIWDRLEGRPIVGGLADPDRRGRLAIAMQGMTMNPNLPLVSMIQDDMAGRRDERRDERKMNMTAQWLASIGREDLIEPMMAGAVGPDQVAAIALAPEPVTEDPAAFRAMHLQALAAGFAEGSPEYQEFMAGGGSIGGSNNVRASSILADGTTIQSTDQGVVVYHPSRGQLFGEEASAAIEEANRQRVEQERLINEGRRTGTLTADASTLAAEAAAVGPNAAAATAQSVAAFDSYRNIRSTLSNIDNAIAAIDAGGQTGLAQNMLPNITVASAELRNSLDRMGLDIIGAVTFGALSEAEMRLAMDTAAPRDLGPAELREWLVQKRDAQAKVAEMMLDAASFLGTAGNTIPMWIERNERARLENGNPGQPPASGQPAAPQAQAPVQTQAAPEYTGPGPSRIAQMTAFEIRDLFAQTDQGTMPQEVRDAISARLAEIQGAQ